ncbi:MAG: hypothetical protein ACFB10_05055 [Salibacteraceae bacterium]
MKNLTILITTFLLLLGEWSRAQVACSNVTWDVCFTTSNASDPAIADGTINVTQVLGGTPPYTYEWGDTTLTTANRIDLPSSTDPYTLQITDSNGCRKIFCFFIEADPVNPCVVFNQPTITTRVGDNLGVCGLPSLGMADNFRIQYPAGASNTVRFEFRLIPFNLPPGCTQLDDFIFSTTRQFPQLNLNAAGLSQFFHVSGRPQYNTSYSVFTRAIDGTDTTAWCNRDCTINTEALPFTEFTGTLGNPGTDPCGDTVQFNLPLLYQSHNFVDRFQFRFTNLNTAVPANRQEAIGWIGGTGGASITLCGMSSGPANISGQLWFGNTYNVTFRSIQGCDTSAWTTDTCLLTIAEPPCGLFLENETTGQSACGTTVSYNSTNQNSLLRIRNNNFVCYNSGVQVETFDANWNLINTYTATSSFYQIGNVPLVSGNTYHIVLNQRFGSEVFSNCEDTCTVTFINTSLRLAGNGNQVTKADPSTKVTWMNADQLQVLVDLPGASEGVVLQSIKVMDITGKDLSERLSIQINGASITIGNWDSVAPGHYIVQGIDREGVVYSTKINKP